MPKETIADKLAKKAFASPRIQESWNSLMQDFEPILAPAFVNDMQARIHITSALNKARSGNIQSGLHKLNVIQKRCKTDADKAAWYFCSALCFELAGLTEQMTELYVKASELCTTFYYPCLRIAKQAHQNASFSIAEEYYNRTIQCFDENRLNEREKEILASVYTNLASSLTMMHRYEEAKQALSASRRILPTQPMRSTTEAILYAAMGLSKQTEALLQEIPEQSPDDYAASVRKMTSEILNGTHPHFYEVESDTEKLDAFWKWFAKNQADFIRKMKTRDYEPVLDQLENAIRSAVPFLERNPELGIEIDGQKFTLILSDCYAVGLHRVYQDLLLRMPPELKEFWAFQVEH